MHNARYDNLHVTSPNGVRNRPIRGLQPAKKRPGQKVPGLRIVRIPIVRFHPLVLGKRVRPPSAHSCCRGERFASMINPVARGVGKFSAAAVLLANVLLQLGSSNASAEEVCRFVGTTDPAGRLVVTTDVAATDGVTKVDVAASFESTTMFWLHIEYLIEELSVWRAGELDSVAVNSRYLLGKHVVRQQWDEFQRDRDGLQAFRVQAKTLTDFRRILARRGRPLASLHAACGSAPPFRRRRTPDTHHGRRTRRWSGGSGSAWPASRCRMVPARRSRRTRRSSSFPLPRRSEPRHKTPRLPLGRRPGPAQLRSRLMRRQGVVPGCSGSRAPARPSARRWWCAAPRPGRARPSASSARPTAASACFSARTTSAVAIRRSKDRPRRVGGRGGHPALLPPAPGRDGARAIINAGSRPINQLSKAELAARSDEPEWLATLPAGARHVYDYWKQNLRPGGFGFSARVVDFPGGTQAMSTCSLPGQRASCRPELNPFMRHSSRSAAAVGGHDGCDK